MSGTKSRIIRVESQIARERIARERAELRQAALDRQAAQMHVEFVDELPTQQGRQQESGYSQSVFATALKARPGVWAKVPEELGGRNNTASNIRKGIGGAAFRGGEFDAEWRNGQLYIRYVGEDGAQ